MFRSLLVPVDLSEKHHRAVEVASEMAKAFGATVHLLHVTEQIEGGGDDDEFRDFYTTLRERAERALERWRGEFAERGVEPECEIRLGKRGPEILSFAEQTGCDLILLTSHAIDREQPGRGFGTLSHQIALIAPCPVLLVR
jgi:nucleotide-binding universal stress UspA family protein